MIRRALAACVGLVLGCSLARGAEPPETLLSPTTQLYIRWDGVTGHAEGYRKSALGSVMAGPTGNSIGAMLAKLPGLLGADLLTKPLLDGKPTAELRTVHADLKRSEKAIDLLLDRGAILALELNEPRLSLADLGNSLGAIFNGKTPGAFYPDAHCYLIVPDVGDKAEVLFGSIRLLLRLAESRSEALPASLGRTGFAIVPADPGDPASPHMAWWREGDHFVFYIGSAAADAAVKRLRANAASGGLLRHPLFRRCQQSVPFESVARGFIDTAAGLSLARKLAAPLIPGFAGKLDAVGIGSLNAIVFSSGFDGKQSRALYEFDMPERKGFARIVKAKPVTGADLPPLPPDVSRFSLLRIDPKEIYSAAFAAYDAFSSADPSDGAEPRPKSAAAAVLRRRELERDFNRLLGINLKDELLPHLGDKLLIYQTPIEGFSVLGTVVCISVKDGKKVLAALDRSKGGLEALTAGPVKVRRKKLGGVEIREVYSRGFLIFTPTYAVAGDWLVLALHPQPVQGFVLRHAGALERWQPDAATAARLASLPADAVGIQFCNPRETVHSLCCVGPAALNLLSYSLLEEREDEFDPLDIGLVPNGYELGKHLFPNLTFTRDDGKTLRIEVNESFSVPLEFLGFEPLLFLLGAGGSL